MKLSFWECIRRKYLKRLLKWALMKKILRNSGLHAPLSPLYVLSSLHRWFWMVCYPSLLQQNLTDTLFLKDSLLPPSYGHNVLESQDTALCSTTLQNQAQCWNIADTEDTVCSTVVSRSWLLSPDHNPLCSRKEVSIPLSTTAKEAVTESWTYSVDVSWKDGIPQVTDVSVKTFSLQYHLSQKYWVPVCSHSCSFISWHRSLWLFLSFLKVSLGKLSLQWFVHIFLLFYIAIFSISYIKMMMKKKIMMENS